MIRAFGPAHTQMTLAQVAAQTDLSRAAARRCLITLIHEGYAVTDGKHFSLSPKVLDLGYAFLSSIPFWERAKPIVDSVARQIGETTCMAVLDQADIVFVLIARLPSQILTLNLAAGSRLPAYATSVGRVLLSGLPENELGQYLKTIKLQKLTTKTISDREQIRSVIAQAREVGWSLNDGELEEGLLSIAVPIKDQSGRITASLNITAHSSRITGQQMIKKCLPVLLDAAASISGVPEVRTARRWRG